MYIMRCIFGGKKAWEPEFFYMHEWLMCFCMCKIMCRADFPQFPRTMDFFSAQKNAHDIEAAWFFSMKIKDSDFCIQILFILQGQGEPHCFYYTPKSA